MQKENAPRLAPQLDTLSKLPWWILALLAAGLYIAFSILTDEKATNAFWYVSGQKPDELFAGSIAFRGLLITVIVSVCAYLLSICIGVIVGLGRVSTRPLYYNLATLYVEVVRGVPILVLLMYIAFVAVPAVIVAINGFGDWLIAQGLTTVGEFFAGASSRDFSNTWRVIFGLGVAYGAFSAEIVRAGIESVEKGQMEAARALGMSYWQGMRLVVLPQAFRRVLPAFGNDFVAMVKDSSLVSVLGVQDITQLAKLHAASTFTFFQTYSILAFLYLILTIMLTRAVRWVERRFATGTNLQSKHL